MKSLSVILLFLIAQVANANIATCDGKNLSVSFFPNASNSGYELTALNKIKGVKFFRGRASNDQVHIPFTGGSRFENITTVTALSAHSTNGALDRADLIVRTGELRIYRKGLKPYIAKGMKCRFYLDPSSRQPDVPLHEDSNLSNYPPEDESILLSPL